MANKCPKVVDFAFCLVLYADHTLLGARIPKSYYMEVNLVPIHLLMMNLIFLTLE